MQQQSHRKLWMNEIKQKQKQKNNITFKLTTRFSIYFTNDATSLKDGFIVWRQSQGRFLANNILLAWCLVMAGIQLSLIKKQILNVQITR